MRYFFDRPPPPAEPLCDHPDCDLPGLYKAPKSRDNLRDYHHFCLDHVRAYNKKWNYFAGFKEDEIYAQMRADVAWDRPTWPAAEPSTLERRLRHGASFWGGPRPDDTTRSQQPAEPAIKQTVRNAFSAMGLTLDVDFSAVKAQFRKLVKKYHPDTRPDDPKANERFKVITEAYVTLKGHFSGDKGNP